MRSLSVTAIAWAFCFLAAFAQTPGRQTRSIPASLPETNPYASAADIALGRALFSGSIISGFASAVGACSFGFTGVGTAC